MSLIENETCADKECHHRSMETVKWSDSQNNIPIGLLIDAIQHGYYERDTINELKGIEVSLSDKVVKRLISETISDSIRFQLGLILHNT